MFVYCDKILNMLLWVKVMLCLCFYSYDKTTQICSLKKFSTRVIRAWNLLRTENPNCTVGFLERRFHYAAYMLPCQAANKCSSCW